MNNLSDAEEDDDYWRNSSVRPKHNIFNEEKTINPRQTVNNTQKEQIDKKKMFSITNKNQTTNKAKFYVEDESFCFVNTNEIQSSPALVRKNENQVNANTSLSRISDLSIKPRTNSQKDFSFKEPELESFKTKTPFLEPSETIDNIIANKPFWFDLYKNKSQKINLLDTAINSGDGNAILAVVLFLKRSLSKDVFVDLISTKQEAINHYVFYLEQIKDLNELIEFYKLQGKNSDAAITTYRTIINGSNKKKEILENIKKTYNNEVSNIANKHLELIQFHEEMFRPSGYMKALSLQNDYSSQIKTDLVSVNDTISFCVKNNFSRDQSYNSDYFKKYFNVSNRQYAFIFIKIMAESHLWSEIDKFTKSTSQLNLLLNTEKRSADISWESITSILVEAKAPIEELTKYLKLVDNASTRLEIAIKHKVHDIVIDTCKKLKDKESLMAYRNKLSSNTQEYLAIDKAIKETKWK